MFQRILLILAITGYVSSLNAPNQADAYRKAFCNSFENEVKNTDLSEDDRKRAAILTDIFCKDSLFQAMKDIVPLEKCAQRNDIKQEIENACGKIENYGSEDCSKLVKFSKCSDEILEKRCTEIVNITEMLTKFKQVTMATFLRMPEFSKCSEELTAALGGAK